ncbi:MAG: hypothetical protein IT379_30310 [Deltaproteobacteria bacterium]|nr:hypothetical protein [Deltaproteobacteria bacterium]
MSAPLLSPLAIYLSLWPLFAGFRIERAVFVVLDERRVPRRTIIREGGASEPSVSIRYAELVDAVLASGERRALLAHNHVSGSLQASAGDIHATAGLAKACKDAGVSLTGSYILAETGMSIIEPPRGLWYSGGSAVLVRSPLSRTVAGLARAGRERWGR